MAAASYRGLHYLLEKILLVPPMVVGEVNLKNSSDTTHILLKQFQIELLQFLYLKILLLCFLPESRISNRPMTLSVMLNVLHASKLRKLHLCRCVES